MNCPSCGGENPATNRFCGGCGGALARICSACGHANSPDHRFCGACGAPLVAPSESAPSRVDGSFRRTDGVEARKVVTVVFADLIGSTALHERLDAESARSLMGRYYGALHAAVEAHGGMVVKLLGDGVMAAFGLPRVAEDDAMRAVSAALAMQQAFRALAREQSVAVGAIGLRVAVNTGEVVVDAATDDLVGDPINVAARLQDAAQDGDVVIGESTRRLVGALVTLAPLGPVTLRGRAETVAAYRVVSLERPAVASAVTFVGREEELGRLAAVYEAALAAPAARLAVVLGSPGLGKSRLLDEFTGRLEGATVLVAPCEAAGGATFAPLAKALRAVLGVATGGGGYDLRTAIDAAVPGGDADRSRIAASIGALLAGTPAAPEETFFVVRRLLAGLAAAQPVVLVLDDIHWAEPLLLDLIEHLVQWSTGVPLLLLAAARPELRDARSSLAAPGRLATDVVMLGGLDAAAATRLAANVIGADALPAVVAGRVLATSEGNPLFLGELVRMLVDDGALKREGDRWTTGVDLAAVDMPPTIHALLAARIERLRAEDRLVLERAAIVGRQFSRAAVAHLLPRETTDLDARLEALRRSELIEPDAGWFLGDPALRFHHGLIRDAAYRRVLKGTRAELHERVADWIASRVGEAVEHDETIGWHLEQAHRHLGELGPIDDRGRALGERATRYLAAAGRRALARDDVAVAADLLGRAVARLDGADPARADLALDWCEALLAAGDVGPAARAIDELGRFTAGSDRLRAWHTCFACERAVLTDPQTLRTTADTVAAAAAELAAAGDEAGEAKAHLVHANALARLGKVGACEAALDKALAAARRANDRRRSNTVLAGAPLAALWGPSPVTRASGRCLDVVRVLRITEGAPAVEAVALRCQALLEALRGRSEAAARMITSSRRMIEELGITQQLLEADVFTGLIRLLQGDAAAAERCLRGAYEGLRSQGLGIDAARAAAFLGRALLAQGRAGEAEALSHESEALAGDDLGAAITWRGVRAEALALRGAHAAAVELARAAVDLATATDVLLHHADARLALAAALRAAGRRDEADAEERRAIELREAKGATVLVERARRGAGDVSQVDRGFNGRGEPVSRLRRCVHPNAATARVARLDAAMAARDRDALAAIVAEVEPVEVLDHTTGTTYVGGHGHLVTWHMYLSARDLEFGHEPLAALGESLALFRLSISASDFADSTIDVGAYEMDVLVLHDADARSPRTELFPVDKLGDAVVRLYECHAERLPDGPERDRAAATARSIAAMFGSFEPERFATAYAPAIEFVDHRTLGTHSARGSEAALQHLRAWLDLADGLVVQDDDVLRLQPDALLLRRTLSGTDRAGGGAFERPFISLLVFGGDGLLIRREVFDAAREADALARFDVLAAELVLRPTLRRVRANRATVLVDRMEAALAARDARAVASLYAEDLRAVHHVTGTTLDRQGVLDWFGAYLGDHDVSFHRDLLAALGDSLALIRLSWTGSATNDPLLAVGGFAGEELDLLQADPEGRVDQAETFAADRLADAVVRLYERYADLLPDGPERDRAAATARSVAAGLGPYDLDRYATAFAPDIAYADRRTLGLGSAQGADAVLQFVGSVLEVADGVANRVDDVLGLRADAFVLRWANFGTERVGGGAYDRDFLLLGVFGTDGLQTHLELFDPDHDAEALTRFDELTPDRAPRPVRRVRLNAATANATRIDAAIAARDIDAIAAQYQGRCEVIDHKTGATWDREGALATWRMLLRASNGTCRHEPLATLGNSLALCRQWVSASGVAGETVDVGAYEIESVNLVEVDGQGRCGRAELFAPDKLGDAVVRLYERYADLLPDGPERIRAAAMARSVAVWSGPPDLDRFAASLAPSFEGVDHRIFGTWSARGPEEWLQHWRFQLDLVTGAGLRIEDVLALEPDGYLALTTWFGANRASGGAYENHLLALSVFGADGLLARAEGFEADAEAEALARFDELTADRAPRPVRRVRPKAATANLARCETAIAARDADALPALLADEADTTDHTTGIVYDRQGALGSWRALLQAEHPTLVAEPLATLGDSLVLCRESTSASGFVGRTFDVGPYERVEVAVIEVDAQGRQQRGESFAADRLGDAVVRLYERYAELLPDGPARARAAATPHALAAMLGPYDLDRYATALAPDVEYVDHRTLGLGSADGADALLRLLGTLLDLADEIANRIDDVLGLRSDALLLRWTNFGTTRPGGGAYERHFIWLGVLGTDGLLTRIEVFDADRDAEALARFDALVSRSAERPAPARPLRVENAATRAADRVVEAWATGDWGRFAAVFPPGFRIVERRRMVQLELDWDQFLESFRLIFEMTSSKPPPEVLATRGDRLALLRSIWIGTDGDSGPIEIAWLTVLELDDRSEPAAWVVFDPDALDAAYAELDARYLAGEAAPYARTWEARLGPVRAIAARDWERLAAGFAPGCVIEDHRPVGLLSLSVDEWVASVRVLLELRPDARYRVHHVLALDDRRSLTLEGWEGDEREGAFESAAASVRSYGTQGIRQWHLYGLDQLDAARACYEKLAAKVPPRIENAATRAFQRAFDALLARDWERFGALFAPGFRGVDRRKMLHGELQRDEWLASYRPIVEMTSSGSTKEVLATRGERLLLGRYCWRGTDDLVGPSEIEYVLLIEVDDRGDHVAVVMFDPGDLDAAYAELDARYAAGEAAPYAAAWQMYLRQWRALAAGDWEQFAATFAPDFVIEDHRPVGLFASFSRDQYVASVRAMFDLRPDATFRLAHVLAIDDCRALTLGRWAGGETEGTFEIPVVVVRDIHPEGNRRWHIYALDQLDEAWACYDALRPDPLRIPPNVATRTDDRNLDALVAGDWEAVAATCAPSLVFEDRRRFIRLTGDRDMFIANCKLTGGSVPQRLARTVLATAGVRLALARLRWSSQGGLAAFGMDIAAGDEPELEIEHLLVTEVDTEGRLVAIILFDPDDRRAASAELLERYARSDAARCIPAGWFEAVRALNAGELDRLRAVLPDDFVVNDHRRTGLGGLESADAYVASVAALFELTSEWMFELSYIVAAEKHGLLAMARAFGTLADGGEFEQVYACLPLFQDDRFVGIEMFEPEDLEVARARFEELRPDPTRIPPNAASRAWEHGLGLARARDWEGLRALASADFTYEDRQKHALVTGDVEVWIKSSQEAMSWPPWRLSGTLLGTAGDRIMVQRTAWTGEPDTGAFEIEHIRLVEVAADGRFVAWINFDLEDRSAAFAEAHARFVAGEAAAVGGQAPIVALARAFARHGWETVRGCLAHDAVVCDHRAVSVIGAVDRDRWVESLRTLDERAPDVAEETLCIVTWNHRGRVDVCRRFGMMFDRCPFEHVFVRVLVTDGPHIQRLEVFDVGDTDQALARFAELCRADGGFPCAS